MSDSISSRFSDEGGNLRVKVIVIFILLTGVNVAAWVWALAAFHNHNYPILLGTATLAYTFGLRPVLWRERHKGRSRRPAQP